MDHLISRDGTAIADDGLYVALDGRGTHVLCW